MVAEVEIGESGLTLGAEGSILVTGGCGFIGRHLCRRLRLEGYRVTVLDSLSQQVHGPDYDGSWMNEAGIDFIQGSVCDSAMCHDAMEGCDSVIHLAAETGTGQSMYEMRRYVDTNVTGTAVLMEACIERRVPKIVLSSSRAVYGEGMWTCTNCGPVHPSVRSLDGDGDSQWLPACPRCGLPTPHLNPTDEDAPIDPASIYGISKLTQELLTLGVKSAYPADVSILRFFNVFGPGQSLSNPYTGVLAVFTNRARENRTIDLYEDGEILRDFVYVEDVIDALVAALRARDVPVCNIGSGRVVSIRYLAQTIIELLGSTSELRVTGKGRVGDVRGLQADVKRATASLSGWTPRVQLEQGLRYFLDWAMSQAYEDTYESSLNELSKRGLYR